MSSLGKYLQLFATASWIGVTVAVMFAAGLSVGIKVACVAVLTMMLMQIYWD